MSRRRHSVDQIIGKLCQADVGLGPGEKNLEEACRALEITVQTCYRWRQKCGSMQPAMANTLSGVSASRWGCQTTAGKVSGQCR